MEREPFSLQDAWAQVGEVYAWIVSLFGAPEGIASRRLLRARDRAQILAWLGPVEALARRLLLLKALTAPKPNDAALRERRGRVHTSFADRPLAALDTPAETWRVRFCVMPYGVLRRQRRAEASLGAHDAPRGGAINLNALPLARRLEALRRVLENPAPALARLARLLAAQRETVVAAFRPYRPPAMPVQALLPAAQREIELALNST